MPSSFALVIIGIVGFAVVLLFVLIMLMVSRRGQRPIHPDPSGRFPEPPSQDWLSSSQRRFIQPFFPPSPEPEHHHHHHHHQPGSIAETQHHHPAPSPEPPHHHHSDPPSPPPMHHHS